MILTRVSIENLASELARLDVDPRTPLELTTMPRSGRPYVVLGDRDGYGKEPRLVIDDVGVWNPES